MQKNWNCEKFELKQVTPICTCNMSSLQSSGTDIVKILVNNFKDIKPFAQGTFNTKIKSFIVYTKHVNVFLNMETQPRSMEIFLETRKKHPRNIEPFFLERKIVFGINVNYSKNAELHSRNTKTIVETAEILQKESGIFSRETVEGYLISKINCFAFPDFRNMRNIILVLHFCFYVSISVS